MTSSKRPVHYCTNCDNRTWATGDLCRPCRISLKVRHPGSGLVGGTWRLDPKRRVQVWVPDEQGAA